MGIRTLCFVLAIVTIGHWYMWVFLVASVLLRAIAVIIANSNAPADPGGPDWFEPDPATRALESGSTERPSPRAADAVNTDRHAFRTPPRAACKNPDRARSAFPVGSLERGAGRLPPWSSGAVSCSR